MATQREIIDVINGLEARFPVAEWRIGDLDVWPWARIQIREYLLHALNDFYVGSDAAAIRGGSLRGQARAALALFHSYGEMFKARGRNPSPPGRHRPADVLLVSDGTSGLRFGGVWVDKFCDPIAVELRRRGLRSEMLVEGRLFPSPTHAPATFIQPLRDRVMLRRLKSPGMAQRLAALPGYNALFEALSAIEPTVAAKVRARLPADVASIADLASRFAEAIRRKAVRAVIMVNWYNIEGLAFCLAAHRCGVPSTDLQHGAQGENHCAYGRWLAVPSTGFTTMPDWFWCWDPGSARVINAWASQTGKHHAVVGGHPLITTFQDWMALDSGLTDAPLCAKVAAHADRDHVLFTLHGRETPATLDSLVRVVKAVGPSAFWWIRTHPAIPAQRGEISRLLAGAGISNADVEIASSVPLYSLLSAMNLHVTQQSSTTIEAALFGIPTVLTHIEGVETFPEQVQSGVALFGATEEEVVRLVSQYCNGPASKRPVAAAGIGELRSSLDCVLQVRD